MDNHRLRLDRNIHENIGTARDSIEQRNISFLLRFLMARNKEKQAKTLYINKIENFKTSPVGLRKGLSIYYN